MSKVASVALVLDRLGRALDRGTEWVWEWDERAMDAVSASRILRRFDLFLTVSTYLGYGYLWAALALALIVFGTRVDQRNVLIGLAVMLVTLTLVHAAKGLGGRPRPSFLRQGFHHQFLSNSSFPSNHAATSFAMAHVVFQLYPWWDGAAVYAMAGLIGLSRVYLREHFPLDVVGGALLGIGVAQGLTSVFFRLVM